MENKEFTCRNVIHSPKPIQCFRADKFVKTNILRIPDTITEQHSVEISGNNLKFKALTATMNDEENVSSNLSEKSDDSSASTIIPIDNSYAVNFERKLLGNSDSDEDLLTKKKIESGCFNDIARKLGLNNETISTPPNILKREIWTLRAKMAEADEFHDLEMEILKGEKNFNQGDTPPYAQLFEKYAALMDLYTTLKSEYDEYRKEQVAVQIKTADCFESLCSEIEASDSSLNFDCLSFVSFDADIKSSTMMENISEIEAPVVSDATMLEHDPLAVTQFKTPGHFPSRSAKKLFPEHAEKIKVNVGRVTTMQLLDIETTVRDKVKEVEDLEQRLYKVEDLSFVLQAEHARVASKWANEKKKLEEILSNKTEEFEALTGKLKTEIIELNPSLRDFLIDATGTKLLSVFIQTIMERCKGIEDNLNKKFHEEKDKWEAQRQEEVVATENLKKRLRELEEVIAIRDEEISLLQCHDSKKTRMDLASANEVISKLKAQVHASETANKEMALRFQEMEKAATTLEKRVEIQNVLLQEIQNSQSLYVSENENLKKSLEESEKIIVDLRMRLDIEDQNYNYSIKENEGLNNSKLGDLITVLKENTEVLIELLLKKQEEETDLTKWISQKTELDANCKEFLSLLCTYCKLVKENFAEEFETVGRTSIERLENRIQTLEEKNEEVVAENGKLEKLLKLLKQEKLEAESTISSHEEEILLLKQVKSEAAAAQETVIKLQSQVLSSEALRFEKEEECHQFQEANANLRTMITTKEAILKDLENYKDLYEKMKNECKDLKTEIQGSDQVVFNLKTELVMVNEERSRQAEQLESLRKLEAKVVVLEGDLELAREEKRKKETEMEELTKEIQSLKQNEKVRVESENSKQVILKLEERNENLEKMSADLENKVAEAEVIISFRDEEIKTLKSYEAEFEKVKESLALAEKVKSAFCAEKSELEARCKTLLDGNTKLKEEMKSLEKANEFFKTVLVENEDLKEKILKSEEIIADLKCNMEKAREEQNSNEERMKELLNEIEACKNDEEFAKGLEGNSIVGTGVCGLVREKIKSNPALSHLRGVEILSQFAETVLENRQRTEDLVKKFGSEKENWASEMRHLKNEIRDLNDQNEVLKALLHEAEKRFATLQSTVDNLRETEDAAVLEFKSRLSSAESLQSEMGRENTELKKSCEDLELRITEAQEVIFVRNEEIRSIRASEEKWKRLLAEADARNRALEEKNGDLQTSKEALLNKVQEVERERKDLRTKIQLSQNTLRDLEIELESTKEELCNIQELVREMEELGTHRGERKLGGFESSSTDRILELPTKSILGVKLVTIFTAIMAEKTKGLEAESRKERTEWEAQRNADFTLIENLRNQMKALEIKISNTETKSEEMGKEVEELRNERSEWEARGNADRTLIESLRNQMKALEIKISDINAQSDGMEREVEELRKERSEWKARRNDDLTLIESLRNQIKTLEMKISHMKTESEEMKKEGEVLKGQNACLKEDLGAADEAILRLRSQLGVVESEKSEADSRCRELQEEKESLEAEVRTKRRHLEELEGAGRDINKQLLEAEGVIAGLKAAAAERNSVAGALEREVESLRREKEKLERLVERMRAEENKENLTTVLAELEFCLEVSVDFTSKSVSGKFEEISALIKSQTAYLKTENKNLNLENEQLKEKVRELNELMSESSKASPLPARTSRTKSGRNSDLFSRRLDKLEEINHNLADLFTQILTLTAFTNLDKLKLGSVREFPNVAKQVLAHFKKLESEMEELRTGNTKLDEECDSYAKTIKELKKDAVSVWKSNKSTTEALEDEIAKLKEEKVAAESERRDLIASISSLNAQCQKLKAEPKPQGSLHICGCGNELKKINDMKRTLLIKEQKILELQDLEAQNTLNKSQIKYLENALEQEKKKVSEEKEKAKKLESELRELAKGADKKKPGDEKEILEELRMCGSLSGGVVQEFVDKEKMRKLAKDIGILKELCRARYAEIKRLEAENAALKKTPSKNSNQMDSPIRTRAYNQRNKTIARDARKPRVGGKENDVF